MDKCVRIVVALAITGHIVTGRSYIPDVRHKEAHRGYDYPAPYHHHPPGRWHHDQDWAQSSSSSSGSYGRPSSYQKEHKPHKHQYDDKDWSHHSSGSSSSSEWDSGSWEYPDYPGHGSPDWSQHSWGHGHGHGKPQHQQWPQHQPGMDLSNKPNRDHDRPSNTAGTNPQTSPRATSESEDLLAQTVCIRSCPVTSEYNPVCGSNNVTYSNPGRLECAKFCGVDVSLRRNSACPRPTFDNAQTTTTSSPITTTTTRPPLFITPTRFTTVVIPATAPTSRPPQTNPSITISPDILNSIFTSPSTTTEDDQYEIDIRTRSRFRFA
ncbi:hypothetical protein O0L34_g5415 [Tuta absoluta]|nr:hypothetical protein O0L34_g5415 [Tuta absoluta]